MAARLTPTPIIVTTVTSVAPTSSSVLHAGAGRPARPVAGASGRAVRSPRRGSASTGRRLRRGVRGGEVGVGVRGRCRRAEARRASPAAVAVRRTHPPSRIHRAASAVPKRSVRGRRRRVGTRALRRLPPRTEEKPRSREAPGLQERGRRSSRRSPSRQVVFGQLILQVTKRPMFAVPKVLAVPPAASPVRSSSPSASQVQVKETSMVSMHSLVS